MKTLKTYAGPIAGTLAIIIMLIVLGCHIYNRVKDNILKERFLTDKMGWSPGKIRACKQRLGCQFFNTLEEQTAFEEWKEKQ